MRKTFLILAVAALVCLPALAFAQTEFSLGGFIKLDAFWDSAAMGKNLTTVVPRSNNSTLQHGRLNATSQGSCFNFTIKGPKLWGATTTGFIEMDFDQQGDARQNSGNSYIPRLRHAFFRLNWPGTELLMGQYWGLFSTFQPETIQDGGFQNHGFPATDRIPQVRLTQSFSTGWCRNDKMDLAILVAKPVDVNDANFNPVYLGNTGGLPGQTSETPQVQGSVTYEADLWGKAAFYGRPKAFTAQVAAGWQRTHYATTTTGQNPTQAAAVIMTQDGLRGVLVEQGDNRMLNNWAVQGSLFIPVIPTHTPNLAGTMSLTATAYVGEGLEFLGNHTGQNSFLSFTREGGFNGTTDFTGRRQLQKCWGGNVQLQYYFTNQWYLTYIIGTGQNYGINRSQIDDDIGMVAFFSDPVKGWWESDISITYRPVTALKFSLGYAYSRTDYFQKRPAGPQGLPANNATDAGADGGVPGVRFRDMGDAHRVEFGAWFFF